MNGRVLLTKLRGLEGNSRWRKNRRPCSGEESRRETTEVLYAASKTVVFISNAEGDNEQVKSQR